jgi:hypothetical protein
MALATQIDTAASPPKPDPRLRLIEARLRQTARGVSPPATARLPSFVLDNLMRGDAGHLHRAHDLRQQPIESNRRLIGPLMVRLKRTLLRLLHPLPEVQSDWNAANARMVTFLLRQVSAQARSIETLERQVAELYRELDR